MSRNIRSLVDQIWPDVCQTDPTATGQYTPKLGPAYQRGFREDNVKRFYLWRAIDHEGVVLYGFVSNRRDASFASQKIGTKRANIEAAKQKVAPAFSLMRERDVSLPH